jgi:pyruvate kinase
VFHSAEPLSDWIKDVDARVQFGIQFGQKSSFIQKGDAVVVVTGWQKGSGFTNTMRIVYVE